MYSYMFLGDTDVADLGTLLWFEAFFLQMRKLRTHKRSSVCTCKPNPVPLLLRTLLWSLVTLRIQSQIVIIQKTSHVRSLPISPHMIPTEIYCTLF